MPLITAHVRSTTGGFHTCLSVHRRGNGGVPQTLVPGPFLEKTGPGQRVPPPLPQPIDRIRHGLYASCGQAGELYC